MKYTTTAVSLLTLLSTSTAQSISDVPGCASKAALDSFTGSGCPISDAACICKNQNFLDSLLPVVRAACSPEELQRTVEFTTQFCANAGVDLAITTSSAAASPTATDSTISSTGAPPSAAASNGTLTPGNSTGGGTPQSPDPTPQPAPDSGVAGMVGLARNAGILGVVVLGTMMVL